MRGIKDVKLLSLAILIYIFVQLLIKLLKFIKFRERRTKRKNSSEKIDKKEINKVYHMLKAIQKLKLCRITYVVIDIIFIITIMIYILVCFKKDISIETLSNFVVQFTYFILPLGFMKAIIKNKIKNIYKKEYRIEVINQIVKENEYKINYFCNKGIEEEVYQYGCFEKYDRYRSEDLLEVEIDKYKIRLGDVIVDNKDKKDYYIVFLGIVSYVSIDKNINDCIMISANKKIRKKINIDNEEFNAKYDVYSRNNNELLVMRLLSPDITTKMNEISERLNLIVDIVINNSNIIIRFHHENLFEPNIINIEKEAIDIHIYMMIIEDIIELNKLLIKQITWLEV